MYPCTTKTVKEDSTDNELPHGMYKLGNTRLEISLLETPSLEIHMAIHFV